MTDKHINKIPDSPSLYDYTKKNALRGTNHLQGEALSMWIKKRTQKEVAKEKKEEKRKVLWCSKRFFAASFIMFCVEGNFGV